MNEHAIFLLLSRSIEAQEVTLTVAEEDGGWCLEINYDYRAGPPNERFIGQTLFTTREELDAQLGKIIPSFLATDYLEIEAKANFWRLRRPAGPHYIAINADQEVGGWCLSVNCALGHVDEGSYTKEYFKNRPSLETYLAELVANFTWAGYTQSPQIRANPTLN